MDISKVAPGRNPPYDLNAFIEIPPGGEPVKYEFDKEANVLVVDRFLHTSMRYPANYGFVPNTLASDGDPIDIIVVTPVPVAPGVIVRCRPIGALIMEDEHGEDEKVIAVPVDSLHPYYTRVESFTDLPEIMLQQIAHFFEHYKDLEPGKWVRISKWVGPEEAGAYVMAAIARYHGDEAPTPPAQTRQHEPA